MEEGKRFGQNSTNLTLMLMGLSELGSLLVEIGREFVLNLSRRIIFLRSMQIKLHLKDHEEEPALPFSKYDFVYKNFLGFLNLVMELEKIFPC